MRRFGTEVLSARNVEMRWTLDDASISVSQASTRNTSLAADHRK
jgi:hypothetical protein